MGQPAPRVAVEQADIARLERHVLDLPDEALVEILLADGDLVRGTVAVRPSVQVFIDGDGNEGINGLARIDDELDPAQAHFIWLTDIAGIRRVGSA